MDPTPLIKAAPEISRSVAAVSAAIPFTSIIKKMLGPAADELAEMWKDKIRLYRYENQISCVRKAEQMAKEAGFTPSAVPPKILFPLLEGVSFEDNDDIHTMWAALLSNASSPTESSHVRPGFIALLRQMSSEEAAILKYVFVSVSSPPPGNWRQNTVSGSAIKDEYQSTFSHKGFDEIAFFTSLDSLEAAELIRTSSEGQFWKLTPRGYQFLLSCSPPM